MHYQCIHQRIIKASSVNLSMHHQCIHQCIINAFINIPSIHLSIYHQYIYLYTINSSSLQQMHQFRSFNSFFHLSNSFILVHLHCCSAIRSFDAVTPSTFFLPFYIHFTRSIHFSGLHFDRSPFVTVFNHLPLYYFCASLILDLIPYPLVRYLAVLIHNFMLWRKNPQCSATCCITMLLSLNELTSGVNSVASMRKTNFRTNLGMGGVDMPSMRSAVNDNVGFEIEGKEEDIKGKKDKVTDTRGVRFTDVKGPTDEMLSNNIIRRGIPEGRRFSSRFPARQIRASNS